MRGMFLGGTAVALGLIATVASAQVGATLGAGAGATVGGTTAGGSLNAGVDTRPVAGTVRGAAADTTATAGQASQEVTGDLKRATRKSRRDVASTTGGAAVGGRASVEARAPGGG